MGERPPRRSHGFTNVQPATIRDEHEFMFKPVEQKINFPELEERILKFWKENKIFEKSVEKVSPKGNWTFLDGPPFVTGMPHYGTLLSSIPKDVFGRYWTMKGYRVRRVWGWDGHGLPIENKVENKLKIKRKKDIEDVIGVKNFIDECLGYVQEVSAEWEWYVDHIGRWVDFKNAYKTWDLGYMETVMWVFKQIYEKGYIYKGLRVSLYCPHCATPISNFEVAMDADNYKEIVEPSNVYKYKVAGENKTYFLAWSTTPWNKIVTLALAVNPNFTYVKVKQGDEYYILAKSRLEMLLTKPKYEIVEEMTGSDLIGQKYEGNFDFFKHETGKIIFEVIDGHFVTATEGTGIVTIAAYGEEDLEAMKKYNVQIVLHIDEEGKIKPEVGLWAGEFYLDVNPKVNQYFAEKGLIYREDMVTHSVATCWRCHERLIYAPQNAWYIDIQQLKPQLAKTNEEINWFPPHFKHGRFLKSLLAAPDWCISRSRYWGSPVPVWECLCGERFVPGSIVDLEKATGEKITNLHKPEIDEIIVKCPQCGQVMKRTSEVLDSWVEAGSASFAERHFPFEKGTELKDFFPPDFIVEYTGQIRAWFYVLHVITNALYKQIAFKNVSVTGVILGTDGRKMSKNYGNYPDPKEMLLKHGGDALRLYLLGSPVMNGEDIRISEEEYRNQVRGSMLILWNVYNFFVTYANIDKFEIRPSTGSGSKFEIKHILDQWIRSLLNSLIADVTKNLESYDTVSAVKAIDAFIENLSTWYVRRSRDRIGPTADDGDDKNACYATLYEVLVTLAKLLAPLTPFLAEEMFKNLTGEESVHLSDWPNIPEYLAIQPPELTGLTPQEMMMEMETVRKICELGHAARKQSGIKVRQPLRKLEIRNSLFGKKLAQSKQFEKRKEDYEQLIKDELNVKEIVWVDGKGELSVEFETTITPELKAEGEARDFVREVQELRKEKGCRMDEKITVKGPYPKEFADDIKKETLALELVWQNSLEILTG